MGAPTDLNNARDVESVRDRSTAKAWVATLPAADSTQTLLRIDELLEYLEQQDLLAENLLDILERLRSPFSSAVRLRMPECENRALPLSPREAGLFLELVRTTRKLSRLYVLAAEKAGGTLLETLNAPLDRGDSGQRALAPNSPVIYALQQALDLLASIASAHYRARVVVPDGVWTEIGRLARLAQQADCLDVVPQYGSQASTRDEEDTCRAAFGYAVMMRLANPFRMSLLEMGVARYCAIRWGHKLGFRISAADRDLTLPGGTSIIMGPHLVKLDTVRMCSSVRMRMEALRTGKQPEQLGFSAKLSTESCYGVLERIYALWSRGQDSDVVWRKPLAEQKHARALLGLPKLYRTQKIPEETKSTYLTSVYSYQSFDREKLEYANQEREQEQNKLLMQDAEAWEILSENAEGFICMRSKTMPRLVLDQLITLTAGSAVTQNVGALMLGRIHSLRQEYDHGDERLSVNHKVGIKLLPGLPKPIGVQIDGAPATDAYWLQEQPALQIPESLILPLATYQENRQLFILLEGRRLRVQLDALLQRGLDFDQVIYTVIN